MDSEFLPIRRFAFVSDLSMLAAYKGVADKTAVGGQADEGRRANPRSLVAFPRSGKATRERGRGSDAVERWCWRDCVRRSGLAVGFEIRYTCVILRARVEKGERSQASLSCFFP